jgi:hypothetical protein
MTERKAKTSLQLTLEIIGFCLQIYVTSYHRLGFHLLYLSFTRFILVK